MSSIVHGNATAIEVAVTTSMALTDSAHGGLTDRHRPVLLRGKELCMSLGELALGGSALGSDRTSDVIGFCSSWTAADERTWEALTARSDSVAETLEGMSEHLRVPSSEEMAGIREYFDALAQFLMSVSCEGR